MTARLKSDINCRALSWFFAVFKGVSFGVKFATSLVPAFTDDFAVLDNNCSDKRIWRNKAFASFSKLYGSLHIKFIIHNKSHQTEKPRMK